MRNARSGRRWRRKAWSRAWRRTRCRSARRWAAVMMLGECNRTEEENVEKTNGGEPHTAPPTNDRFGPGLVKPSPIGRLRQKKDIPIAVKVRSNRVKNCDDVIGLNADVYQRFSSESGSPGRTSWIQRGARNPNSCDRAPRHSCGCSSSTSHRPLRCSGQPYSDQCCRSAVAHSGSRSGTDLLSDPSRTARENLPCCANWPVAREGFSTAPNLRQLASLEQRRSKGLFDCFGFARRQRLSKPVRLP